MDAVAERREAAPERATGGHAENREEHGRDGKARHGGQGLRRPQGRRGTAGKIRLPAPKNIEKSVRPMRQRSLRVKLFIVCCD